MADSHSFIFAVFLMYGIIFMIYALAAVDGYTIEGLPDMAGYTPGAPDTSGWSILDYLFNGVLIAINFFIVLFVPITSVWYIVPLNWAIVGTAIYLMLRLIRGGG